VLAQLNIRNLAVIDAAELDFSGGFTVLTGETGAGKSILVDALALALGERADTRAVRSGSERCEVTAVFDISDRSNVLAWLRDNDLDEDGECILRRVVAADGRSRGYVNGRSTPMQTLRELGEQLVDICGQQAHQSLRHARVQRDLLDQFGGHQDLITTMLSAHAAWRDARTEFETLRDELADRSARLDLLRHHVHELEALHPQAGEFEELERAHRLAANSGRIAEGITQALEMAYEHDDASAHSVLGGVRRKLDDLVEIDLELATATNMLAEAEILIGEAADALRQRHGQLEHDPAEEARIDERLAAFHDLARKHRCAPGSLHVTLDKLVDDLANLETGDQRIEELSARADECQAQMIDAAEHLTGRRREAAAKLTQIVTDNMQVLGMPNGRFEIVVRARPDELPGASGHDRIEFLTAANPGQAAGPLTKVASGGELSRISLALQVAAMAVDAVPTLIFDEVDAGVGGGVAEIVGGRLRELADNRQVLCVTHLAQVASQANQHLRVAKITDGKTTHTTVGRLDANARVEEIARMIGGIEITERTRAHAEEMLQANAARKAG
jgi:DNA repair protein RecN (Recombination protein N)